MSARSDDYKRHSGFLVGLAPAAVLVALVSSMVHWSYDEAIWLAVARKVAGGARLYVDVIDHKPPTVIALTGLLDWLPGPYMAVRGVFVGIAFFTIVAAARSLSTLSAGTPRWPGLVGLLVGTVVVLESGCVLTVELVAVTVLCLTLLLVRTGSIYPAALLAATAASFDIRAVLFFPAIVVLARESREPATAKRLTVVLAAMSALGIALLLVAGPDARFSLIELNVSSRSSLGRWPVGEQAVTALVTGLPFAMLIIAGQVRLTFKTRGEILFGGAALILAVGSVMPFPHYWAYSALVLPLLAGEVPLHRIPPRVLLLTTVSLVPLVLVTASSVRVSSAALSQYEGASTILTNRVPTVGSFTEVDDQPYLAALLPTLFTQRSPVLGYAVWPSSRRASYTKELDRLVDEADAIVENGVLSAPATSVRAGYGEVVEIFRSRVGEFRCSVAVGGVTIWFRDCG